MESERREDQRKANDESLIVEMEKRLPSPLKQFRCGIAVGRDYVCSKCGLTGHRLWRDSCIMLDQVELLCAACAEIQEVENIASYARFHQEWECGIGNLIPARPTPEGDTFWGHTSGDTDWWYELPQYKDADKELAKIRVEYKHTRASADRYCKDYLEADGKLPRWITNWDCIDDVGIYLVRPICNDTDGNTCLGTLRDGCIYRGREVKRLKPKCYAALLLPEWKGLR